MAGVAQRDLRQARAAGAHAEGFGGLALAAVGDAAPQALHAQRLQLVRVAHLRQSPIKRILRC
jgi:hypothetical protein